MAEAFLEQLRKRKDRREAQAPCAVVGGASFLDDERVHGAGSF
jgi:hypothetical protein